MEQSTRSLPFLALCSGLAALGLGLPAGAQFSVEQATLESGFQPTVSNLGGAFGRSLAADGKRLYVGAPWEEFGGAVFGGAIYVYDREPSCYRLVDKIPGALDAEYGSSLAVDGDTLVHSDYTGNFVQVLRDTPSGWVLEATLDAESPSVTGVPVAISGDTVAIGADNFGPFIGNLCVYSRTGSTWTQDSVPVPDWNGLNSTYGYQIAIDGDVIAAGAPLIGRMLILRRTAPQVWSVEQDLLAANGPLALEGDTLVVASGNQVTMYDHAAGSWTPGASFTVPGVSSLNSAAIEGDLAVVGSKFGSVGGSAYWFERVAGNWTAGGPILPSDPTSGAEFGGALALEGGTLFVGAGEYSAIPGLFVLGKVYAFADAALPSAESYCTAGVSASGCQAQLAASGRASASAASGFTVSAGAMEGAVNGLFFMGTGGRQANPWGNGTSYQCVVPPVSRAPVQVSTGTPGACDGDLALDLNATWCPACPRPALNFGAGAEVQLQLWYRDPASTSNQTTSLSDALELCLEP